MLSTQWLLAHRLGWAGPAAFTRRRIDLGSNVYRVSMEWNLKILNSSMGIKCFCSETLCDSSALSNKRCLPEEMSAAATDNPVVPDDDCKHQQGKR